MKDTVELIVAIGGIVFVVFFAIALSMLGAAAPFIVAGVILKALGIL